MHKMKSSLMWLIKRLGVAGFPLGVGGWLSMGSVFSGWFICF